MSEHLDTIPGKKVVDLDQGLLDTVGKIIPQFLPPRWHNFSETPAGCDDYDIALYGESRRTYDVEVIGEIRKLCQDDPNNLLRLLILMSGGDLDTGTNDFINTLREKTDLYLGENYGAPIHLDQQKRTRELPQFMNILELHGQSWDIYQLLDVLIREIKSLELIDNFFQKLMP